MYLHILAKTSFLVNSVPLVQLASCLIRVPSAVQNRLRNVFLSVENYAAACVRRSVLAAEAARRNCVPASFLRTATSFVPVSRTKEAHAAGVVLMSHRSHTYLYVYVWVRGAATYNLLLSP
jgi:hypothetical protein